MRRIEGGGPDPATRRGPDAPDPSAGFCAVTGANRAGRWNTFWPAQIVCPTHRQDCLCLAFGL